MCIHIFGGPCTKIVFWGLADAWCLKVKSERCRKKIPQLSNKKMPTKNKTNLRWGYSPQIRTKIYLVRNDSEILDIYRNTTAHRNTCTPFRRYLLYLCFIRHRYYQDWRTPRRTVTRDTPLTISVTATTLAGNWARTIKPTWPVGREHTDCFSMRYTTILRQSFRYRSLGVARLRTIGYIRAAGRRGRGVRIVNSLISPSKKATTHWLSTNENNPFHIKHEISHFRPVTLPIRTANEICPITSTLRCFSTTQNISFNGIQLTLK